MIFNLNLIDFIIFKLDIFFEIFFDTLRFILGTQILFLSNNKTINI